MKVELGLVALACALVFSNVERSAEAENYQELPKLGAYDPAELLDHDRDVGIDHMFLSWQMFRRGDVASAARTSADQGRQLLITLEPWTRADDGRDGGEQLLQSVAAGGFDAEIWSICREIGAARVPTMVSWGHEMDETAGRFPWADKDPVAYLAAYRHFVDQCRPLAPRARFGWTPKGERGMERYYPGDGYVDFVGLTLFDSQDWNRDHHDSRTLADKFGALHSQVTGFGKPVVLAEFGVSGDQDYRKQALSCFRRDLRAFPDVEAVVYFNDRETWPWPAPYGRPDWRVTDHRLFECREPMRQGS